MAVLDDIASRAGVSRNTVARALGGRTKANWPSAARRVERIRKIADELGYRPNTAARATSTGRFNAIGVLRSTDASGGGLGPGAVWTIEQEAHRAGMHLVSGQISDAMLTDPKRMPMLLREWSADGLVVSYTAAPQRVHELIDQFRIPVIWGNADLRHDAVLPDEAGGARTATEYLAGLGHRRILFYGPTTSHHFSIKRRHDAYCAVMREAGLEAMTIDDEDPRVRFHRLQRRLAEPDRPTAVFCSYKATTLLGTAMSLGLSIPDDLSVLVLRDKAHIDMGAMEGLFMGRAISAIELPGYAVGKAAFDMVREKIERPDQKLPSRMLPYCFDKGATCAPPNLSGPSGRT